jgi:hypothetical protein
LRSAILLDEHHLDIGHPGKPTKNSAKIDGAHFLIRSISYDVRKLLFLFSLVHPEALRTFRFSPGSIRNSVF